MAKYLLVAPTGEAAMSDERWEEQFKQFLRKTGDDFRRAGGDIKAEAQKLFDAAMEPDKQQRVRDRLKELSSWAREKVSRALHTSSSSEPSRADEKGGTDAPATSAYRKRGRAKRKKIKGKPSGKSGKPKR